MENIAIVSDTTSDMTKEMAKDLDIHLVDAYVHFGNESYTVSDFELTEFLDLAEQADKSNFPTTSQPKPDDMLEIYTQLKKDGYDTILSVHLSDKLSGTINSANIAKDMMEGIAIKIINTQGVSALLTACLIRTRRLVNENIQPDLIVEDIERFGKSLEGFFSLKTLEYLFRGGRMSRIKYRLGWLLNIKPILRIHNGEIAPYAKARGVDNARKKVYEIAIEQYDPKSKFNYIIAHSDALEYAQFVDTKIKESFPNSNGFIMEIGIVVSVHVGRGALLVFTYVDQ